MQQYLIRRLLLLFPTLLLVSVAIFGMVRAVPGDVISVLLAEQKIASLDRQALEEKMGLDKPVYVQYFDWMGGIIRGDLGESLMTGKPVRTDIQEKFKLTFILAMQSMVIAIIIAVPIGVIAATRQDSPLDYLARSFGLLGISLPNFWVGTMIIVYGSIWFTYSPPLRYADPGSDPISLVRQFLMPSLVLGWILSGTLIRMIRTTLLEVLREDYIRTAWAKGLRERVIVSRHAFKNALIPVVTIVGIQLAGLLGGTVIMESVFNIPGVGRLLVGSVGLRDYPVIQGIALAMTLLVLLVNLLVDLSYAYIDPRIRYS